jgi:CheY-like chemotaxis protein
MGKGEPLLHPPYPEGSSHLLGKALCCIPVREKCALLRSSSYTLVAKWRPLVKRLCMPKLAKVLLVDDDESTTYLNARLLKQLAVADELLVAHNGLEALHTLHQTCAGPDAPAAPLLVLLDVNMPVMNGVEFLQAYQQHPLAHKSQVVIVVLTTSEHSRELESIHALPGAADILPKPLTREKVETILQRHFH